MDKREILRLGLSIIALSLPIIFLELFGKLVWLNWTFLDWLVVLLLLTGLALAVLAFPEGSHLSLKFGYSLYPAFLLALALCAVYQAATNNWSAATVDSNRDGVKAVILTQQSGDYECLICYKVLVPEMLGFQLVRVNLKDVANHFDTPEHVQIVSDEEVLLSLHGRKYRVDLNGKNEVDASALVESAPICE
ncbi:MAG: hypothetical protein HY986_00275 [Candidatus Melainabacteria bacterium]|nr:hypothetical protein [Candidatus Melainabacteria bacterium]